MDQQYPARTSRDRGRGRSPGKVVSAARMRHSLVCVSDSDRLYFRQLLSGRDFAAGDMFATQMRNFAYLIGDRQTGDCVVVDPAYAAGDLLDTLEADGMHLSGVLVTHHHPDHVGGSMMGFQLKGLAELLERAPVPVHVNTHEAHWVSRVTGIGLGDLTPHETTTRSASATSKSSCCTPPVTRRAASAFCSTAAWSPATRCSWMAAAAPTFPVATPTRCIAACSGWLRFPATRRCFRATGIRPSRAHRCRRSSVPTTFIAPLILISGEC